MSYRRMRLKCGWRQNSPISLITSLKSSKIHLASEVSG